jgi:transcription initiation factor IIE alpha subunit
MACMSHECVCGFSESNNSAGPFTCPRCGKDLVHVYDEPGDDQAETWAETDEEVSHG